MKQLLKIWQQSPAYQDILQAQYHDKTAFLGGLTTAAAAFAIAAFRQDLPKPSLILTATDEDAQSIYQNLQPFLAENIHFFPLLELLPFEVYARNIELTAERIGVLSALIAKKDIIIVASINSLLRGLVDPEVFAKHHLHLTVGQIIDIDSLLAELVDIGYERSQLTEIPGTFSQRGSIIDIFPLIAKQPIRLEFFDDELESIRYFSPQDQRSLANIEQINIAPAKEMPWDQDSRKQAEQLLEAELAAIMPALDRAAQKQLKDIFNPMQEYIKQGIWDNTLESLLSLFYPKINSLLDYLPTDANLILYEAGQIAGECELRQKERHMNYNDLLEMGKLLPTFYSNFNDYEALASHFNKRNPLLLSLFDSGKSELQPHTFRQIFSRDIPNYAQNPQLFEADGKQFANFKIFISASSKPRLKRIGQIVSENNFPAVNIIEAAFNKGFESAELKMVLITEQELFAKESKRKPRKIYTGGEKIHNFIDLEPGHYVVHTSQGIGRYIGVERLQFDGISRDYLLIQYAGTDRLYLPVDQLDLIQKYIGNEGAAPKLYKLGGGDWQKVKARVRSSVQDMARELLELYAKRNMVIGHAFAADSNWQHEFEDAFPYMETPDQLKALHEIKTDMELDKVMDRLLCGDVGYGKTEIALRAAFKAVMDNKQVAILAPTTVLAQQHLRTIEDRFSGYPVKAGCLSRFATAKQQKELVKRLNSGDLDIIVGTHRLLSTDVIYKDLGLLIVDEEQRFGVAHKEKIKAIRGNVDVLTLSATPIPRTLHMSLVGMRDMSIIATPPEDRRPVQTYVLEFEERLIREALLRELNRGGQVYFVHNRVNNIEQVAEQIQKLVPKAKILIGHGQMKEKELEQVMVDFVDHKADILLCTTIIESGLDIPNVNTMIVNEAENFGLAQLYQLRGRVGRSERQAFAYFTYRRDHIINEMAKKRLVAIRDFTELGAGFKIAMRDMELRGAGNILGPEQSGHIMAVGFDLYCRLLQEEMACQSGEQVEQVDRISTQLELQLNAYIPDKYIVDAGLKIELYKRIAAALDLDYLADLAAEITDRYGKMPQSVTNLFLLGKVKYLAKAFDIISIFQRPAHIEIKMAESHPLSGEQLQKIAIKWAKRINFNNKKAFIISLRTGDLTETIAKVELLIEFLIDLNEIYEQG